MQVSRTQQRSKRWKKYSLPHKKVVIEIWAGSTYTNEDFFNVMYHHHGRVNHKNRDRPGGHFRKHQKYNDWFTSPTLTRFNKNDRFFINEGLQDLKDQIRQEWEDMFIDDHQVYDHEWEEYASTEYPPDDYGHDDDYGYDDNYVYDEQYDYFFINGY